jgi:DNA-directed RNA polymerase subunit RPC12/RpoP
MIKLKFEHYNIDISNEEGKRLYANLIVKIKSLGHDRPFDSLYQSEEFAKYPKEATVETDFLFENQFNTKEGQRLFDWREPTVYNGNVRSRRRFGYYISEGLELLNEVRRTQYACGYCGKRYDMSKGTTQEFCDACLSSEYLTKERLELLYLVPVIYNDKKAHEIRKKSAKTVPFSWSEIEKKQEIARRERLKREAARKLERLKAERALKDYEISVQIALLENGIEIDNLIYYSHTGSWCLGWRDPITQAQREDWQNRLFKIADKIPVDLNGIELINLLDYKMKNEAAS